MREPWQLKMFSKTLKKKQKLALLLSQVETLDNRECLLITNGDNNGALNYRFREAGGRWTWVENEEDNVVEMEKLLGEPVLHGSEEDIPVADSSMDLVVTIDVHEHLEDCATFNRELARVARPGATVIVTTPNGDRRKPVTILKNLIGMSKERYGHKVIGYNVNEHRDMLHDAGLEFEGSGSYSKFFTEMLELAINFAYVMVLARRSGLDVKEGTIAPSTSDQLRSIERQYRLYSALYPALKLISLLDRLLFFTTGYAVSVVARKPG